MLILQFYLLFLSLFFCYLWFVLYFLYVYEEYFYKIEIEVREKQQNNCVIIYVDFWNIKEVKFYEN